MGFLTGGEKYRDLGNMYTFAAMEYQSRQRDAEFGRNLLSNIRQARLARSQLDFSNSVEGITTSSSYGATANISSTLAGEYGYAIDTSRRLATIQGFQYLAGEAYEKANTMDRRSATAGQILGQAMGYLGGGIGYAIANEGSKELGAFIGSGVGAASSLPIAENLGADSAAKRGTLQGSINSFLNVSSIAASKYLKEKGIDINSKDIVESGGSNSYARYTQGNTTYFRDSQSQGYVTIKGLMQ